MKALTDTGYFDELWNLVLDMMKDHVSGPSYDTWFQGTRFAHYSPAAKELTILAANSFTREWLEKHYTGIIENALVAMTEQQYAVRFVTSFTPPVVEAKPTLKEPEQPTEENTTALDPLTSPLNPRYTFDTFVIGQSNRFAHAASLAVAEKPNNSYNPLFIYGGVGLGKTHLMHAVAHYVHERHPHFKVLYLSSERFTNEFIAAIRDNNPNEFRDKYRSIDVLLIDDIQFLARKEQTQEEFFHTFNALHEAGKQIVITSDRPPREIPTLTDRLRSRFEWGLITDIQPPDIETRIAILQRKAKAEAIHLPEDVTQYIASQVDSNIRELEGALIRVMAYSSLVNEDFSLELAVAALKDIVSPSQPRAVTASRIQKVVGDHFSVRVEDIKAKKRTKDIAFPRQIAMYLTRELTDMSLPKIGDAFNRDHTTILHACEKVVEEMNKDQHLKLTVERLAEAIRTLC